MFRKVRFLTKSRGATAGLVLGPKQQGMTIAEISRLFPMTEAMKMSRIQFSPMFTTFDEAFNFSFED